MIVPTNQEATRVVASIGVKYTLQPGSEEDQRLTVINESTEHAVVWDEESHVKRIKETRGISRLTAEQFVWHEERWWYQDDWYRDVYAR
jgi:hypothetical protein